MNAKPELCCQTCELNKDNKLDFWRIRCAEYNEYNRFNKFGAKASKIVLLHCLNLLNYTEQ